MISVVTYGRNDNYGFNLQKRTAIGFNCLAESLTENDEILFVDYNTPGHLPTLPEFIWDTFTDKALQLIKVIRIPPDIHQRIKADSPLPVLENVSRNAAIVRSNPRNHWILSTNPDVIMVLASRWKHLDQLLAECSDSFYEMPRFDIPESVWSGVDRTDPRAAIGSLRDWLIAHNAAVVEVMRDYRFQKIQLFDGPGDFQLAPREYFFRLRGFDETMNKYFHSDLNLAKRMWLLNDRRTDHLLDKLWVLHQDHYLTGEWAKNLSVIPHNDYHGKVLRLEEIEANNENWGLQDVPLQMFSLVERMRRWRKQFSLVASGEVEKLPLSQPLDWRCQPLIRFLDYTPEILSLYLREILQVLPANSRVFYLGRNPKVVGYIARLWQETSAAHLLVQELCKIAESGEAIEADVLLVDCHYKREEYWQRRIRLLEETLQDQVAKGRLREEEAEEEVFRFSHNVDTEQMLAQVTPLWEKHLARLRMPTEAYVILMGCTPTTAIFARFQELFATKVIGMKHEATWLERWHSRFQRFKVWMQERAHGSIPLKAFLALRILKRRAFRKFTGHESLMGWVFFDHVTRRARQLFRQLKLRPLYIHHRLIVMQVEE